MKNRKNFAAKIVDKEAYDMWVHSYSTAIGSDRLISPIWVYEDMKKSMSSRDFSNEAVMIDTISEIRDEKMRVSAMAVLYIYGVCTGGGDADFFHFVNQFNDDVREYVSY